MMVNKVNKFKVCWKDVYKKFVEWKNTLRGNRNGPSLHMDGLDILRWKFLQHLDRREQK